MDDLTLEIDNGTDVILDRAVLGDEELISTAPDDTDLILQLDDDLIIEIGAEEDLVLQETDEGLLELEDSYTGHEYHDSYTGPYTVVPRMHEDQKLRTNEKIMRDDVTVKEIPVTVTTNIYGGKTVVIG